MPFAAAQRVASHRRIVSRGRRLSARGLALVFGLVPGPSADANAEEPAWRPLPLIVDGKVAEGWRQVGWGGFVVEDGALRTACEWKTMIITLPGDRIQVDLEGQRVTELDPANPQVPRERRWFEPKRELERPRMGYLGLQNHDPGDVVWFKEDSVCPLPDSSVK